MSTTSPKDPPRSLASDNHSGVHPQILESLLSINKDHCHSYEGDPWSLKLRDTIKNTFGPQFHSYLVFNGSAANVLALNHFVKPWNSVLCSDQAHLHLDECGAPQKHIGCKLLLAPTHQGKISAQDIRQFFIRRGDQHYSQLQAVSLTQPTELGTVYSLKEIQDISAVCKELGLFLHIDGARLANAVVHLNCTFKDIASHADAISLGGTKNGLLGCEMVLINSKTSPQEAHAFKFERKQSLQLPSKARFLSQQFLTYFENHLWTEIAKHSTERAQDLSLRLTSLGIKPLYPVESNAVFCALQKKWIKPLREKVFFYVWEEESPSSPEECVVRLMTSFDTTEQDLIDLCTEIARLQKRDL